jgi:hypothetical protein
VETLVLALEAQQELMEIAALMAALVLLVATLQ